MPKIKYYKFINADGTTPQGYGKWDLPKGRKPGEWQEAKPGEIKCCTDTAIHVMRDEQIVFWLDSGAQLWEVEVSGKVIMSDDKEKCGVKKACVICQVKKWNEKNASLLACDFAEEVMPIWDKYMSDDDRPRNTIKVARRFANGKATKKELAAAWAAAWAAVRDAVWDAARDAARAAAWAARNTARDTARDAAWAAWDAARDSASDAVWDARNAAWAAARAAARAAMIKKQTELIKKRLGL